MCAHVVEAFFSDGGQLIAEAIPNGCFSDFDCEGWGIVATPQEAKDIYVPISIPVLGVNNGHA